jgi:SAM-dependent methyltransferase
MKSSEVAEMWEANAETWTRHARAGYDVYRDALNTPAFLAMLPPISDLHGLDIGCGEGSNTRELARLGAQMHAIDIAPTFVRHAQSTEASDPFGILFQVADALSLPFADNSFDFVTAFMSMMDMPDQGRAMREAHRVLRPGGFFNAQSCTHVLPRRIAGSCGMPMAPRGRLRSGLLRRGRRGGRDLVVRNLAARGARTGRAVPDASISSDIERMGRDHLQRRIHH